MVKKIISFGVLLVMAFSLTACVSNIIPSNDLAGYKTTAKATLVTYAEEKGEENYPEKAWATIGEVISNGKTAIDTASNKPAVDVAVETAKAAIDAEIPLPVSLDGYNDAFFEKYTLILVPYIWCNRSAEVEFGTVYADDGKLHFLFEETLTGIPFTPYVRKEILFAVVVPNKLVSEFEIDTTYIAAVAPEEIGIRVFNTNYREYWDQDWRLFENSRDVPLLKDAEVNSVQYQAGPFFDKCLWGTLRKITVISSHGELTDLIDEKGIIQFPSSIEAFDEAFFEQYSLVSANVFFDTSMDVEFYTAYIADGKLNFLIEIMRNGLEGASHGYGFSVIISKEILGNYEVGGSEVFYRYGIEYRFSFHNLREWSEEVDEQSVKHRAGRLSHDLGMFRSKPLPKVVASYEEFQDLFV